MVRVIPFTFSAEDLDVKHDLGSTEYLVQLTRKDGTVVDFPTGALQLRANSVHVHLEPEDVNIGTEFVLTLFW